MVQSGSAAMAERTSKASPSSRPPKAVLPMRDSRSAKPVAARTSSDSSGCQSVLASVVQLSHMAELFQGIRRSLSTRWKEDGQRNCPGKLAENRVYLRRAAFEKRAWRHGPTTFLHFTFSEQDESR